MSLSARPGLIRLEAKPSAVTEALRRHVDRYRSRFEFDPERMHVLNRLLACRTAKLGTHLCVCDACGWKAPVYNPCRNRHCPQCQGRATALWLEARQAKMLPTPHFQVVFTLPAELRPIAFNNPKLVYGLLFRVGASVLQDLAAQRLDTRLGITAVLHTWTSELTYHPHVHCIVTAGGLHRDDARWVATGEDYLFPGRIMGAMFRGRFLQGLIDAFERGDLDVGGGEIEAIHTFRSTVRSLSKRHKRWVVHVEPPKGRSVDLITKYLARYVKRVAIAGARIVEVTDTDVTFKTKTGLLTLDGAEFVRRFLLHILPSGLRKVRHYGLYAPSNIKVRLEQSRRLIQAQPVEEEEDGNTIEQAVDEPVANTPETSLAICPACGEPRLRHIVPEHRFSRRSRGPP